MFMMDKLCVQLKQMKDKHSLPFYNIQALRKDNLYVFMMDKLCVQLKQMIHGRK